MNILLKVVVILRENVNFEKLPAYIKHIVIDWFICISTILVLIKVLILEILSLFHY